MRAVFFLFYTLETVFNMFCMAFNISGFMSVDLSILTWNKQMFHYLYLITFYAFTVLTLFQSINICTGHSPYLWLEIAKTCAAAFTFILVAILTMLDAEKDFHLMYLNGEPSTSTEQTEIFAIDKEVHPFFNFMRSQSIAALSCGVLYLLHATIVIDVYLTAKAAEADDPDETYMEIRLYVFGEYVHTKLEDYEWFINFNEERRMSI
ncbi:uncharacterized protein LOC115621619 [Scaptodrosophila lebanonensis]|uniref:Uncharacterized protein LOC115621619 n=1 Tax=Drosophila lebanonensis TaxID=7225 RepID=A0A6J2T568_DROLE|nr:uncharacterized protein LOC115621619 [Scaptodrosophila lebanonensis]